MSTSTLGRSKALWATGAVVAALVLGCLPQVSPVMPPSVADSARAGKMGLVRLKIGPFSSMRTAAADIQRVNRVKVSLISADATFQTEETVSLNLSANEAQIAVPFGRNFIVFAQGMNDDADIPGARVGGYFDIADGTPVNVTLTPQTTPVADVLRYLVAKNAGLAQTIDLPTLQRLCNEATASTSPSMINPQAFGDVIVANKGLPVKAPSNARFASGRITGTVEGLGKDEVAIITCNDPASKPYVLMGGSAAATSSSGSTTTGTDTANTDTYRLDNIVPGTWTVRIVASNAGADPVELVKTVTVGTPYEAPPLPNATPTPSVSATATATAAPSASASGGDGFTGPTATADFTLGVSRWASAVINASSNVGISDQPDAAMDGNDNIHLVWRQDFNPTIPGSSDDPINDRNISGAVFYSRWNGQNWSRDNRNISVIDKQGARDPAITVGVDRLPAVVWSGLNGTRREIRFTRFNGQTWTTPVSISAGVDDTYDAVAPDITVDKINGHLYVVWQGGGGDGPYTYFREWYGDGWTPAKRVSSNAGFRPKIVTGYDGGIFIAWVNRNGNNVRYARYVANSWEVADDQYSNLVPIPFPNPAIQNRLDLAVDRQNRIHLMIFSGGTLRYLYQSAGVWTNPEQVAETVAGSDVGAAACVHVDPVGNVHTLWRDFDQSANAATTAAKQGLFYRRRTNTGWGSAESFGDIAKGNIGTAHDSRAGRDMPLLLTDSYGRLHALWSHKFTATVAGTNEQEVDILHRIRTIDTSTTTGS
jgi:hypothetical protein